MRRRLLASYLTLTVFVLIILEVPLGIAVARHERRTLAAEVERDAFVLGSYAEDVLEGTSGASLAGRVQDYGRRTGARVVIVDRRGMAVADTDPTGPNERNFSTRPEIIRALRGEIATGIRHSATLGADLLYVAVPVASGGSVHGAVRITYPTAAVDARINRSWVTLALIAAVVILAAAAVGWRFATTVTKPIRAVENAAHELERGHLTVRAETIRGPPELRSLSWSFNRMAAQLEELVEAQRAFVADASHQLRTPLTALRLRVENLEEVHPGNEVEAVSREVARLEHIVGGLLVLARAEGSRPERRVVDATTVISGRREAWSPYAEERSIHIAALDDPALAAWEIPGALGQILDNLIANAIEAVPAPTSILLSARREGRWVEVHVVDDGGGMSDEDMRHAFRRFWSGRASAGGSGLGLPIVRQLAEAGGGEATLARNPAGGVDAFVRLEASDQSLTPAGDTAGLRRPEGPAA